MAKKSSGNNAIGYVILGIVAIMAIVGLVLLFTSENTTGQIARAGYDLGWYGRAGPQEFPIVAPYRAGELAQPAQWSEDVSIAAGAGGEAERIVTAYR